MDKIRLYNKLDIILCGWMRARELQSPLMSRSHPVSCFGDYGHQGYHQTCRKSDVGGQRSTGGHSVVAVHWSVVSMLIAGYPGIRWSCEGGWSDSGRSEDFGSPFGTVHVVEPNGV